MKTSRFHSLMLVGICLSLGISITSGIAIIPLCTEPGDQVAVAISGDRIVWQDARDMDTNGWDLYMWDPVNGVQPLSTAWNHQSYFMIDGDTIVWQDFRNYPTTDSDIYKWDPVNGEEPAYVGT